MARVYNADKIELIWPSFHRASRKSEKFNAEKESRVIKSLTKYHKKHVFDTATDDKQMILKRF